MSSWATLLSHHHPAKLLHSVLIFLSTKHYAAVQVRAVPASLNAGQRGPERLKPKMSLRCFQNTYNMTNIYQIPHTDKNHTFKYVIRVITATHYQGRQKSVGTEVFNLNLKKLNTLKCSFSYKFKQAGSLGIISKVTLFLLSILGCCKMYHSRKPNYIQNKTNSNCLEQWWTK